MRRVFLLVAAIVLVDTAFFAAIVPLLPHYVDELGLSQTQAGILTASYAAGLLLAALPGGWMAARLGVRPTVVIGLGMLAATSVVFGFGRDAAVLEGARFAQGVGGALSWAGGFAWLLGITPPARRGQMIGSAIAAAIAGVMLGPVIGAAAVELGPRWVFGGVAVAAVALCAAALRVPPVSVSGMGFSGLLRVRSGALWLAVWLVVLPALFSGAIEVLLPLRLDALGASAVAIGAVFLASAAFEGTISPIVGWVSDRRGRLAPMRVGLAGAVALGVLLPLIDDLALLIAATIAIIAVLATFWAPATAMLSDQCEAAGLAQGLAAALMNLAWAGGQVGGGALGGALADVAGDAVAYSLLAGACLATLVALLARGGLSAARGPSLGAPEPGRASRLP